MVGSVYLLVFSVKSASLQVRECVKGSIKIQLTLKLAPLITTGEY